MSLPQESSLTALRLCASAPAAALELLQEPLWTARQQLCQALAATLASGDWLALLPISIMNRRRFACTGWRRCWSMRKNDSRGLPW